MKRATIVPAPLADDGLEALLGSLARALPGCRFAIATPDGSALLGRFGDRFQVWPVRPSLPALGASMRRSDVLVFVGEPRGLGLARAAILAALARARAQPAFLIATPAGAGSRLRQALERRVETLPADGNAGVAIAARLAAQDPPKTSASTP